ncbi:MAG: class I tRNA ligase family protein, partial [Arenimonas sp.]
EDFVVGLKYGLEVLNPIDGKGVYLPNTEIFAGQYIWKANDTITALLLERGVLLASEKFTHSYPHCWRHKSPVAFRATPQWFISMDQANLRADALESIKRVAWIPEWGEARIVGMIDGRPDWCISRQRTWGVPIALFINKQTGEPHARSVELMREVANLVEQKGADAWYSINPQEFLGDESDQYDQVKDILDVWFDSGVTHECVLAARPEDGLIKPADLYLEGSDQHRGWFQSSLLTAIGMDGAAPYKQVLTHGFTVDAHGKKMSKSLGNTVEPQKVNDSLGADVLRLWIASTDYRNEMSVSDDILKRSADAYRRIRNTSRFLLGNLAGFDPTQNLVSHQDMLLLDQWAIARTLAVQEEIIAAYERYDFAAVVSKLQNFCTNDLGALYLDVTKDRLYTMQVDSLGRRSAQTAMYHIAEAFVRWIAPVLSFTADEIWHTIPGKREAHVLMATWYENLQAMPGNAALSATDFDAVFAVREAVSKVLEPMRVNGEIGASLQAEVDVYIDDALLQKLQLVSEEARFLFITSQLNLKSLSAKNAQAIAVENSSTFIFAQASKHAKCVRCWHYREDVGAHTDDPELCSRCELNVNGVGEVRRYF